MTTGFIAVVRHDARTDRHRLLAAGATAVLTWAELAGSTEPDDVPVVLFGELEPDQPAAGHRAVGAVVEPDRDGLRAEIAALLDRLTALSPSTAPGATDPAVTGPERGDVVIATVRPMVDTLKLVDAAGTLIGTAPRDEHRLVGAPIAGRLGTLRAVSRELEGSAEAGPTAVAVLAALVERGAVALAGHR